MPKTRTSTTIDSCTIKGTKKTIKAGDCVLLRSPHSSEPPYVAKVEKIESDGRKNVWVRVRWYYRPEESIGGRRLFHGSKEVFLSDHYDVQSADTIEGKCIVHNLKNYSELDAVGNDDFFCRFEYISATGEFIPENIVVYCKCEMPYNPDVLMVQCESCQEWFHPSCIDMTVKEAKRLDHFFCHNCCSQGQKKSHKSNISRNSEAKVDNKRRRR